MRKTLGIVLWLFACSSPRTALPIDGSSDTVQKDAGITDSEILDSMPPDAPNSVACRSYVSLGTDFSVVTQVDCIYPNNEVSYLINAFAGAKVEVHLLVTTPSCDSTPILLATTANPITKVEVDIYTLGVFNQRCVNQ